MKRGKIHMPQIYTKCPSLLHHNVRKLFIERNEAEILPHADQRNITTHHNSCFSSLYSGKWRRESIHSRVNLFAALRQTFWSTTTLCASVRQRIIDIYCLIQWDIEFPLFYSPFLRQNVHQKPDKFFLCSEDLLEISTQIHLASTLFYLPLLHNKGNEMHAQHHRYCFTFAPKQFVVLTLSKHSHKCHKVFAFVCFSCRMGMGLNRPLLDARLRPKKIEIGFSHS